MNNTMENKGKILIQGIMAMAKNDILTANSMMKMNYNDVLFLHFHRVEGV